VAFCFSEVRVITESLGVQIPLLNRRGAVVAYATVDLADAEWIGQWKWLLIRTTYTVRTHKSYAYRYVSTAEGQQKIYMHRQLLGLPKWRRGGSEIDHRSGDGLDNRRCNIREVTHEQNQQNKHGTADCTSSFRGVYWNRQKNKWHAQGQRLGRKQHIGYFDTEEDAARAASKWRSETMPFSIERAIA
jgi:hypothetical protein